MIAETYILVVHDDNDGGEVMVVVLMVVMMVVMMVPILGEQERGSLCSWAPIAEGTPAQVGVILKHFFPPLSFTSLTSTSHGMYLKRM